MVEIYNEAIFDLLVPRNEGTEKLQIQKKGKDIMIPVSLFYQDQFHGCVTSTYRA